MRLEDLSKLDFNYDLRTYESSTSKMGWNVDQHKDLVAQERPGEPEANGPFERLQEALRLYRFADPNLIEAIFDQQSPLEGRNMLLKAKFLGFTFYFGVRVTRVIDETITNAAKQTERRWGFAYRTLKGHFEVGEIRFIISKVSQTGEIFFEVDAYSKPDFIPNFFYRMGFRVFGRSLQKRFAQAALERLRAVGKTTEGLNTNTLKREDSASPARSPQVKGSPLRSTN